MSDSTEKPAENPAPSATALPTGEPVPSAPSAPAPKAKPLPLMALLKATPSNVDAFLAHLQRCIQTPSGIDTCLLLICYSSRFTGALLEYAAAPAIQRSANRLIEIASSLPPSATLVFSSKVFPSPSIAAILELSKRLKALAGLVSEGRMFLRLWGLIGMYFWARGLVFKAIAARNATPEEKAANKNKESLLETTVAWTQLLSCIAFQSIENRAYLSMKGVMGLDGPGQVKAFRWATRFWGTFVGLEIGRLLFESYKRSKLPTAAERSGEDKSVAVIEQEDREWTETWRKTLMRNCAWFPLTVHWSLEQGLVNDLTVGGLALIPGIIGIRDLWKRTA